MRTIETTVFKFTELGDAAKERAREWYRRGLGEDNYFAESVIEDAAIIADLMGIDLRKRSVRLMGGGTRQEPAIHWSGFWSQGDGACFEGDWHACNVKPGAVAAHVGDSEQCREVKRIAAELERLALEWPDLRFVCRHSGHYSHEHSVSFDVDGLTKGDGEGDFRDLTAEEQASADSTEEDLKEAARDFMRWIYRQLEQEYEYTRSDEQVDESIIANEYEFTEDGERA
jgi:hypothetical protein